MAPPVYTPPSSAPFVPPARAPIVSGQSLPGGAAYSPVGPDAANAAQAMWCVSFANGNDANDGSMPHPLKTHAEWTRRTKGLVPTVPIVEVDIADTDPSKPYDPVLVGYAIVPRTCLLWIHGKATLVPGTSTTINAYRAENFATQTPRAVTANALTSTIYTGPSPYRLRVPARNSSAWITTHTALEAAHVMTICAPYAAISAAAVRVVRPVNATELVAGDTMQIETLTSIGPIQLLGTVLEGDDNPFWNTGNPSYAFGDSCRILVTDFEIGGRPPKNDFSVLPGAPIKIQHSGQGQIWYDGCGVQNIELASSTTMWWRCRLDLVTVVSGVHQFYGCTFDFSYNQTGGFVTIGDCYVDSLAMIVKDGGTMLISGQGGGTNFSTAIFDTAAFASRALEVSGPNSSIVLGNLGHVYGTGNSVGIIASNGAKVFAKGGQLATLYCTANCVNADGTLTGPNTTGVFVYGVNTSATPTGAGVFNN